MAKKSTFTDVKSDLITLQRLLTKHFAKKLNFGDLNKAISQLNKDRNGAWGFEDIKLEFRGIDLGKNIRPNLDSEHYEKAILELRFTKMSWLPASFQRLKDPIQEYQLQLILKISDFETILAKSAWHFDKHPDKKSDNSPEATPEFHHPLYHLHFGGYELTEEEDLEHGNILIVEAPRIMHPPMDLVLAVDFVLNNFYSCHSCQPFIDLISEPDYTRIVKNSRERFWKPFAFGFASNFTIDHNFRSETQVSVNPTFAKNLLTYSEQH